MTAPALIGPTGPTMKQYHLMVDKRDSYARVIARSIVRGWEPAAETRDTFRLLDGAVKTAAAILKACR